MDATDKCDDSVNYNCYKTRSQSSAFVGSSSQQIPIIELSRTPASGSQALISPTGSKPPLCSSSAKRHRKLTSEVWNHFEKKNIDREDVASCNYCKTILKANSKNGTTALKSHMNTCLEIFYDLTNIFSGIEYLTANYFFVKVRKLRIAIVKWMCSDDVTISATAKKMFDKFEKY
ncbi:Uncharacterized protein TCM_026918 [Theobroma cacao]|uniref:BED-type domain-containing protein n=1 Tax=Theobroma cacao TaxID=3641 RepID=A0A061G7F9_THECC|nr:Uncharacterized protein TCM_026918 [Theobroma cacao]